MAVAMLTMRVKRFLKKTRRTESSMAKETAALNKTKVRIYHACSPPYTGNYMPSRPDLSFARLDASVNKTKLSETETSKSKTTVATKSGQVPVNAAKQSSPRATSSISTARHVNTASPKPKVNDALPTTYFYFKAHSPDQGIFDSRCFRHMTGNKSFLIDYQEINGGFIAFGGSHKGGKITRKENSVLFTETECHILSPDFKLLDESKVLLKVSRHDNMYTFDLKNVVPSGGLTCLFAKATIDEFCRMKEIKREFSVARTPQQNGVVERNNRTLIEAARTMLADLLLPTTFWAEAVNTTCYVQNRVLVTKPHNKTPYELLHSRPHSISFMRPFGYLVTILNTLDPLGKFDGKADEGFLLVTAGNQTNRNAGIKDNVDAEDASTFVSTASPQRNADTTADDLTLVDTLMEIGKSVSKDKGKAKMDETESPRKMKQRDRVQISRDEEVAQKLQEELIVVERTKNGSVHQGSLGFYNAEWDDVLARVAAE
ncbi:ribonuclease H-like domain-containing protein [Tanacetum coccineum]